MVPRGEQERELTEHPLTQQACVPIPAVHLLRAALQADFVWADRASDWCIVEQRPPILPFEEADQCLLSSLLVGFETKALQLCTLSAGEVGQWAGTVPRSGISPIVGDRRARNVTQLHVWNRKEVVHHGRSAVQVCLLDR